jgi:pantetheine-phosphate adenylyltransferase
MPKLAVYPGSFDPVTNGHMDILRRALQVFQKVIVAVARNVNKQCLFPAEERVALLREVVGEDPRIEVDTFDGLLVHYVQRRGATSIVRGLRAVADFEYEFQLAVMNRRIAPGMDTLFLMTDERYFYVSSSLVRELAAFGSDVSEFVPPAVERALRAKHRPA